MNSEISEKENLYLEDKSNEQNNESNNESYKSIKNPSSEEIEESIEYNDYKNKNETNISKRKILIEIMALIYLLIGRHYYLISLEGCIGDEFICLFDIQYILDDINYCINSTMYFIFVLFLIQMNLCSKYYLILILAFFIEFIITDRGNTFLHHGVLNLLGLFVIVTFGEIIILLFLLFYILYKNKKRILFYSLLFIFSLLFLIFVIKNKDNYFCKDWDKGLNNTYIDNDSSKYPCTMRIPKSKCLINILGPFLDLSKYSGIKCENRKEEEKNLLKNLLNTKKNKDDIKRIGYPITIGKDPEIVGKPAMYSNSLLDFVEKNLIDMDNQEQLDKLEDYQKPEVIVDFTEDPYGQMKININYKEDLAKERKLKEKKDTNNVLFLFLDNLSRNQFYRQYPKTIKFLEKFLSYEGFNPNANLNEKYHGFEFYKYNKFNDATMRNTLPMFSGVYFDYKNKMISIVKDFKNNGYITANIQDICHKELMSISAIENYTYVEFDHEYAGPNCDPSIYGRGFSFLIGENGIFKKCLYGKESFDYVLEYAKKFWISYKDNKKFMRIVNTYGHEYSGEKSKYTDESLRDFLVDLYENSQLKDTTVFIASDHGFALMGVYKVLEAKDWKVEKNLPIFILLEPDKSKLNYNEQYGEIFKNQQTFITSFDIFYTLRWILYGEEYKTLPLNGNKDDGECLFKYINPKERHCGKYKDMARWTCECKTNFFSANLIL